MRGSCTTLQSEAPLVSLLYIHRTTTTTVGKKDRTTWWPREKGREGFLDLANSASHTSLPLPICMSLRATSLPLIELKKGIVAPCKPREGRRPYTSTSNASELPGTLDYISHQTHEHYTVRTTHRNLSALITTRVVKRSKQVKNNIAAFYLEH